MLKDILYEAVDQVNDARMAGVIGTDGVGVEMILDEENVPHDLVTTELELAWLIISNEKTAGRLGVGGVHDIELKTDELTYLLSRVIPGYYAVMGIDADGNRERARFVLWQMVHRCKTEI